MPRNKFPPISISFQKFLVPILLAVLAVALIPTRVFATNYQANQVIFEITTDGATYRAVKGNPITIKATVKNKNNPPVTTDDKIYPSSTAYTITGFYTASSKVGETFGMTGAYAFCYGAGGCYTYYLAYSSSNELSTFDAELTLNTSALPVGTQQIWVFPAVHTEYTNTDVPMVSNPVTVTVEIYENEAAMGGKPRVEGGPVTTTTTGASTGGSSGSSSSAFGSPLIGIFDIVNRIIQGLLLFGRWVVYALGTFLIVPFLETALNYSEASLINSQILAGWTFVRDIVNMFFILFLIVIGFGTILRIESYNYKKLLVNLIVMALLVNFSLVIGRIIIQIADVAQFTFLPSDDMVQSGQASGITGVRTMYQYMSTIHIWKEIEGIVQVIKGWTTLSQTISILLEFMLLLTLTVTFGALAVFMLIRTVGLWVLLTISPLAYLLLVLPATAGLARNWWSTFLKYVLFGPIFAFFIRLSFSIYDSGLSLLPKTAFSELQAAGVNQSIIDYLKKLSTQPATLEQALQLAMIYLLVLAFLWAGLIVAKKLGIFGSAVIVGFAERAMTAPFRWTGKMAKLGAGLLGAGAVLAGGYAGQRIHAEGGPELRPSMWKEAWKRYRTKRKAEDLAIGGQKAAKLAGEGYELRAGLGRPEDFFRLILNPEERKRLREGGQKAAKESYKEHNELKEQASEVISDAEKENLEKEKAKKLDQTYKNAQGLSGHLFSIDEGDELGKKNRQIIADIMKTLKTEIENLRAEFKGAEAATLQREYDAVKQALDTGAKGLRIDPSQTVGSRIDRGIRDYTNDLQKELQQIHKELIKPVVSNDAKKDLLTRAQLAKTRGDELRAPQGYEHRLERLRIEAEEAARLKGIKNADQLVSLMHEAIRSGNQFRFAAIVKKLGEDYNDNEYLNQTIDPSTGKSYGSGREGMQKFMRDIAMNKLGMDEQSMLELSDEIAYINESREHWENARLVTYENGKLRWMSEDEHVAAAVTEIGKRGPRDIAQSINRLGYGSEMYNPETGVREFKMEKLGLAIAKVIGPALQRSNQMGYLNTSALRRLAENIDLLKQAGVSDAYIREVSEKAGHEELDPVKVIKTI